MNLFRKRNRICSTLVLLSLLILANCKQSEIAIDFSRIEAAKNESAAKIQYYSLSLDRQIDIYLYSMMYVEGSRWGYDYFLASNGTKAIDPIFKRIESKEIDTVFGRIDSLDVSRIKYYLITVLELIDYHCDCISNNQKLMDKLESFAPTEIDLTYYYFYRDILDQMKKGD